VCPHGNKIKCRHTLIDKIEDFPAFIDEYGKKEGPDTLCKICGERLLMNPTVGYAVFGPKSTMAVSDDIRKYIYGKCMIATSYIAFAQLVTDEYVKKLAGNIVSAIAGIISTEFYKIDKIRGIGVGIIIAMKEIVCMIYVLSAYYLLAEENKKAFDIKGKHVPQTLVNILNNVLRTKLEVVREMREISLDGLVNMVITEMRQKKLKAPGEFSSYDDRDTDVFRLVEPYLEFPDKYPGSTLKSDTPDLIKAIYRNVRFLGIIGVVPTGGELQFGPEFEQLMADFRKIREEEAKLLMETPWRKFISVTLQQPARNYIYDYKYMSISMGTKGSVHIHRFRSGLVDGKVVNFADVDLEQKVDNLVCSICGAESKYGDIIGESAAEIEAESKVKYFAIFCPARFSHEFKSGKCIHCGYIADGDNENFYEKHKLPATKILVAAESDKRNLVEYTVDKAVAPERAEYYGKTPKINYMNFWENFGCYEDVTYNQFITGQGGDKKLGILKIKNSFSWLVSLLARIKNIGIKPDAQLQDLACKEDLVPIIGMIKSVLESREKPQYDNYKYSFIRIFNKLPHKIAEFVANMLIKFAKKFSKSEDSEHAEALADASYRPNSIQDNTDLEDGQTGKPESIYEGYDYNGKNEK
jgi:uncharacterized membrane protein